MIEINFKNGRYENWDDDSYTDYEYLNKNVFVVIKGCQWVGIYNIDTISSIVVTDEEKSCAKDDAVKINGCPSTPKEAVFLAASMLREKGAQFVIAGKDGDERFDHHSVTDDPRVKAAIIAYRMFAEDQ